MGEDRNFLLRFWQGEVPLALSFWGVGPLVVALSFALPEGVARLVRAHDYNPLTVLAAIVAIWTIVVLSQLFLIVGVWRAASIYRYERQIERKRSPWAIAAQVVLVVASLNLARTVLQTAVPELTEGIQMALFDDPTLPPYSLRLMRDGSEAEVAGGLKFGIADQAEELFASAPNLKVVHLNSPGGRLGEAIKLARLVRERGVATYTATTCASACTVVFAAGRERNLRLGARLGFHRGVFAGNENADGVRKLLLVAGIEASFVDRAVAQSAASIWYPTNAELVAGHVVTAIVDSYRFPASGFGANAPLMVFEQAMRETPALAAVGDAEPHLFEEMAELYSQGYFKGWSAGQIEDELRKTKISPFIAQRLPQLEDDLLVDYARLLADQSAALGARDPAACYGYATRGGDAQAVALMGAELLAREVALTERMLRSRNQRVPTSLTGVTAANTRLFQALSAQFDVDTAAMLTDPTKLRPEQYALFCNVVVARFRAIAALPPREAGNLLSGLFALANTGRQ